MLRAVISTRPLGQMLRREFHQNTLAIAIKPRVKISNLETCIHMGFMMGVWISGDLYTLSQIPKWRDANI